MVPGDGPVGLTQNVANSVLSAKSGLADHAFSVITAFLAKPAILAGFQGRRFCPGFGVILHDLLIVPQSPAA